MGPTVGIRELKSRLSEYLRRVAKGQRVTVTDRGRPVAVLAPLDAPPGDEAVRRLVAERLAHWAGGKPRPASRLVRVKGKPLSDTVVEDRR